MNTTTKCNGACRLTYALSSTGLLRETVTKASPSCPRHGTTKDKK